MMSRIIFTKSEMQKRTPIAIATAAMTTPLCAMKVDTAEAPDSH